MTGALAGGGPHVKVIAAADGALLRSFMAYDPNFHGGVNVALGDVDNDGYQDVVTAPGPGGGPDIRVFSGKTGALIKEFYAYAPSFNGGVSVAVCDVNNDGNADIVTGALGGDPVTGLGVGGGPHVQVFSGASATNAVLASFYAYAPGFHGGVRVGAADINGDGKADIVTGAGPGGGPHVRVFNVVTGTPVELVGFMAYASNFTGGVFVGANVGADQVARIITGAGAGAGEHVKLFASNGAEMFGIIPPNSATQGATVAVGQLDGDAQDEYVIGDSSLDSTVRSYNLPVSLIAAGEAYPGFGGGVSVAIGVI